MQKTIYFNGKVVTVDSNNTIAEAVLVENGKISKVGNNEEILSLKDENVNLVDLEGKTMLPGFIDPHGHIVATAQTLMIVTLGDVTSREELLAKLKKELEENPPQGDKWLIGFGYDNTRFEDGQHPTKFDLDSVSKDIPITVSHASGHLASVNSKALELYGYVGDDYIVPEGGVVRTVSPDSKEANGVLEENAILDSEKKKVVISPGFEDVLRAVERVQKVYASLGVTTTQDASVELANGYTHILETCANTGKLIIDIMGLATQPVTTKLMTNEGTPKREYKNHYKLAGGKTWLDGSPQGFTAWLSEPYHVVPEGQSADYCGYGTQTDEVVTQYFVDCINLNIQVHVHVNGDEACAQFLRCYKNAMEITGHGAELRPVMVHCQALRKDQLDDVIAVGAVPTFFNDHVAFWGDLHHDQVFGPERAQNISPIGWALEKGIKFTLHQDPPVKMPNQIFAIHTAVNRMTESGRVLGEHQRIPVIEAIKAVTINGAYQYFEEDIKGSIETGKLADLVILDKNPLEVEASEIKNINVLETIKEGNSIFKK
ncbi:amidohydrolase [Clostridium sp. CCUG 7971]|uniref:amidohydrolase n=1 Tax=Clostridium sp. CCUG 7971 TaxID=2811414 RepID=UPI001ABB20AF|nr:amidohydrolase [Clostridium sp. CCUG 7971]MBO3444475.1 amidohydrolase [Clostridium sp. CCUG 7971]